MRSALSKQLWSASCTGVNGPLLTSRAQTLLLPRRQSAQLSFTLRVPKGFPYNSPQAYSAEDKINNKGLGAAAAAVEGETEGCPAWPRLCGLGATLRGGLAAVVGYH